MSILDKIVKYKYPLMLTAALITSLSIAIVFVFSEVQNYESLTSYDYEWLETYGFYGVDKGFGIDQDREENIYIAGFQDGGGPLCLLKYNTNGSLLSNKTWGHGMANDLVIDKSDNIYITGHDSSVFLLKINHSEYAFINKTWESAKYVVGEGIDIDNLGNVYITGYSANYGVYNYKGFLLKCNSTGDLKWNKTMESDKSQGFDVQVDEEGNVYVTGSIQNGENEQDLSLSKYNSSGELDWIKTWGGLEDDCGRAINLDAIGNIYVTGQERKSLNNFDLCLLKYDSRGNLLWEKIWGGDENEFGLDIKTDNSGNIYIIGSTGSFRENSNLADVLLAKFDSQGNCVGFKTWGASSGTDYGYGLILDDQGYAYLTGTMIIGFNFVDIFLLKYDLDKIPPILSISGYNIIGFIIIIGVFSIISLIKKKLKQKSYTKE